METLEQRYEARILTLRALKEQLRKDPAFRADLLVELGADGSQPAQIPPAVSRSERPASARTATYFDAIKAVLADADSGGLTVPQIVKISGLKRSQVAEVLYRSHRDQLSSRESGTGRAKLWTLKEETATP